MLLTNTVIITWRKIQGLIPLHSFIIVLSAIVAGLTQDLIVESVEVEVWRRLKIALDILLCTVIMYFSMAFLLALVYTVMGVLNEPYSAKPLQRSSHTGPPGYILYSRMDKVPAHEH
jgi:hypothetical protein